MKAANEHNNKDLAYRQGEHSTGIYAENAKVQHHYSRYRIILNDVQKARQTKNNIAEKLLIK